MVSSGESVPAGPRNLFALLLTTAGLSLTIAVVGQRLLPEQQQALTPATSAQALWPTDRRPAPMEVEPVPPRKHRSANVASGPTRARRVAEGIMSVSPQQQRDHFGMIRCYRRVDSGTATRSSSASASAFIAFRCRASSSVWANQ